MLVIVVREYFQKNVNSTFWETQIVDIFSEEREISPSV